MSRRKALAIIGGGTILAAGAGAGVFVNTRTPHKALAPWTLAGGYEEARRRALSWAILAPNPHNRQPWLVDLSEAGRITVFVDTSKDLPETDPFDRQITIGLGCFLELLRIAAAEDGYRAEITPFPEGFDEASLDERPVALIDMIADPAVARDPLFAQVPERRSYKENFDMTREVPDAVLSAIIASAGADVASRATNEQAEVERLRALTYNALALEMSIPRTYLESMDLVRLGKAEIEANPDGIDVGGAFLEGLAATGLLTVDTVKDMDHPATRASVEALMEPFKTQMGFVWLTTESNTRIDQLNAGRDWLRANLAATEQGVGLRPASQILQEYPEMSEMLGEVQAMLAPEGGRVQMLGQFGYPMMEIPPAPRWPLEAKIIGS